MVANFFAVRRPFSRTITAAALAALLALAVAACGDGEEAETTDDPVAAPEASAFPKPKGDLNALTAEITPTDEYVASPAGKVYGEGDNRFGFGLSTVDGEQVPDAEVAIYAAQGPNGEAEGPFPARIESLETEAAFVAQTTSDDPDAAKVVYVANLDFDQPGEWRLVAAIKQDDGSVVGTLMSGVKVSEKDAIPAPGDEAPTIHTLTTDDVGDIGEIDTRVPPSSMHDIDFADVVGKKPIVLLFATPALCYSRVCGPVVDVAEQVKREVGDEVAFIHQEIYVDNNPEKGPRPQVEAYNLRSEPWLFVIDAEGKVDTRIQGAFSVSELEAAVDRVTQ